MVGDDVYGEDPTVNTLEKTVADLLGMEEGLYVPSGTMGNQIAIHVHTRPGDEVIVDSWSHIYNFEMGAMSVLSGTIPRICDMGEQLEQTERIRDVIMPPLYYRSATGLIALENTHNLRGGQILPREQVKKVIGFAKEHSIPVHLDGARLWNAAAALRVPESELAKGFDSVMVCLSKGLCAPVGSVLCGSSSLISRARRVRRMFGGGMRQAGILAAAGLEALHMRDRLKTDHDNLAFLWEILKYLPGIVSEGVEIQTNILVFKCNPPIDPAGLMERLREHDILVSVIKERMRIVTHHDVSRAQVEYVASVFKDLLK